MTHFHFKSSILLLLLLLFSVTASAQDKRQLSVASFSLDQFDMTSRNEQYKKIDGNGSLYAIIKVTSSNPDDKLSEYRFDFGNMNHEVVNRDGELWVYVQRNAKFVTISRQGFATINKYDLGLTIEEGRTYAMILSPATMKIDYQMVMFAVKPVDNKGMVSVKSTIGDGTEEMIRLSETEGTAAKNLPFGTYTYKVMAEGFYPSEGSFTLNNMSQTHTENVTLKAKYATVTLTVAADADIFVNGELKGRRTWTGRLNGGAYQVECRQEHHRPTMQNITVVENVNKTFNLTSPTPITGILSVISEPLGATIAIDGVNKGTTPSNITDVLIGKHTVVVSKDGYEQATQTFDITEGQTTSLNLSMKKAIVTTAVAAGANIGGLAGNETSSGDHTFAVKGVQFVMKAVAGGTFQMGCDNSDADGDEKPVHSVTLSSYMIGETEVTQELWETVMGKNPSGFVGPKKPVERVTWDDCQKFIKKLNSLTGQQFRLPTEAEWEYAARGGNKSKGYKYAGSNDIGNVAWYVDNNGSTTFDVKTKVPNELGLYDMSGNTWEWCQDRFGNYSVIPQTNPTGPVNGYGRVCRGGSRYDEARKCRVTYRDRFSPSVRGINIGLRLAL